jgi:AAA15 family ATPase/GTPase
MSTFFNTVHITNFKSLKDVTLSDCKRINLLIGKPNVGKSNILEAIGLFSLPYFKFNKSKKLTQFIRLENLAELFFDGDIDKTITIHTDNGVCTADYIENLSSTGNGVLLQEGTVNTMLLDNQLNLIKEQYYYSDETIEKLKELGKNTDFNNLRSLLEKNYTAIYEKNKLERNYLQSKVKYYKFPFIFLSKKQTTQHSYLIPPIGINLLEAIQSSKIDKELSKIFSEYGLRLLFDKTNQTLRIDKPLKEGAASFPLSSIADTLQRLIFFKTAIASNKDSIILFEEPEAHCFPPYIRHITQEIIDSETNQFFIATHSPYVLNDFLEYQRDDVAIFIADFKDGKTVIKRLTDSEVNDVYEYGIDLFFNSELFTDEI